MRCDCQTARPGQPGNHNHQITTAGRCWCSCHHVHVPTGGGPPRRDAAGDTGDTTERAAARLGELVTACRAAVEAEAEADPDDAFGALGELRAIRGRVIELRDRIEAGEI